jgi:hypothetical protein
MKINLEIDNGVVVGLYTELLPDYPVYEVTDEQYETLVKNLGNVDSDLNILVDLEKKKTIDDELNDLHKKLQSTDYKAIKYAEGLISKEDYAPIKAERQSWRDRINELEEVIK